MDAELQGEQAFVDMAYARLDAMRNDANSMLEGVLDLGRGGTFQSRTERDVIVRTSLARLEQLDIGDQALTFGRIDRLEERPERRRPGASRPSTSVAWPSTAPTTTPWWSTGGPRSPSRSTGPRDGIPQGLVLRRHLALEGRRVVGLEDERFSLPDPSGSADVTDVTETDPDRSAAADRGRRIR